LNERRDWASAVKDVNAKDGYKETMRKSQGQKKGPRCRILTQEENLPVVNKKGTGWKRTKTITENPCTPGERTTHGKADPAKPSKKGFLGGGRK